LQTIGALDQRAKLRGQINARHGRF
jgi:hypothetical protein